ncbi:MAG: DegV family protein [Peptostreptococcaceae bacterium]|nr:DegV family protein [Peptostreptococcaceae bacterium]
MNNIQLVIDSSTDLPQEVIEEYGIGVVDLNVAFGGVDYTGITAKDFYEKMRTFPELPKTSAASPEKFMEQYAKKGDIIMITLTQKLSGTYSAALLAKDLFLAEREKKPIEVIDSTNGCIGAGLLTIFAGEMAKSGKNIQEIAQRIREVRDDILQYGLLETLENAIRSGRVSRVKGLIASALNLKPIVEISDGLVKPKDKARGTKNGLKKVADLIVEGIENKKHNYTMLGIAHANAYDKAMIIKEEILSRVNFERIIITEIGPLMGTHTAEGAVMVSAL